MRPTFPRLLAALPLASPLTGCAANGGPRSGPPPGRRGRRRRAPAPLDAIVLRQGPERRAHRGRPPARPRVAHRSPVPGARRRRPARRALRRRGARPRSGHAQRRLARPRDRALGQPPLLPRQRRLHRPPQHRRHRGPARARGALPPALPPALHRALRGRDAPQRPRPGSTRPSIGMFVAPGVTVESQRPRPGRPARRAHRHGALLGGGAHPRRVEGVHDRRRARSHRELQATRRRRGREAARQARRRRRPTSSSPTPTRCPRPGARDRHPPRLLPAARAGRPPGRRRLPRPRSASARWNRARQKGRRAGAARVSERTQTSG